MPVHNSEIAAAFNEVADLLEIEGANPFRVRAYRNAARTVASLPHSAEEMLARGEDLSELPGIGRDLAGKVQDMVRTGKLALLEETIRRTPAGLAQLMRLPGLGPKRVGLLREKLGIANVVQLRQALSKHRLQSLPGFGTKSEQKLREALEHQSQEQARVLLANAEELAASLVDHLKQTEGIQDVVVAGSFRRRKETVGDLDILATCRDSARVMDRFVTFDEVTGIIAHGPTRSAVRLRSGIQVDLRVVPQASFGAALHYFTGSKPHNIAVRALGVKKGLKISEYGVFRGRRQIGGRTEAEVFKSVGLPYIEPELRENNGEIEAARKGTLPELVKLEDIRGELHAHSKDSDGRAGIEEMAQAARARGYQYLAITDHSKRVSIVHGLDARRLAGQIRRIDRLNGKLEGIRVLKSIEVDILEDGRLDLPNDILSELDLTICSVHSKFNLPPRQQTERILRAMDNPFFNILGHPTGRLLNERDAYQLDLERLLHAAKDRGCFLEINSQPDRLDLSDVHARMAKELGVKLAITTDAHRVTDLDFIRFGIGQARRGWLEAEDVLNTRTWPRLQKLLRRR